MKKALISFDIEEFDFPREKGVEISLDEGVKVSAEGLAKILDVLKKTNVKATFFCTGNFAKLRPDLIKQISKEGHEVACHGVDHFKPSADDVTLSKKMVEKALGSKVCGYRQPRMQAINYAKMKNNGYLYDSSVNPAFIPGRYNHFDTPRKPFLKEGVLEIPTSVATSMRVPLFWLALHLFPRRFYFGLVKNALKKTGYFATYFHPWEFTNLNKYKVVPWYIKKNSNDKLVARLEWLILRLKKQGVDFVTYEDYAKEYN